MVELVVPHQGTEGFRAQGAKAIAADFLEQGCLVEPLGLVHVQG
jgi:hypothetical protein